MEIIPRENERMVDRSETGLNEHVPQKMDCKGIRRAGYNGLGVACIDRFRRRKQEVLKYLGTGSIEVSTTSTWEGLRFVFRST
jgi:hypothetical protein